MATETKTIEISAGSKIGTACVDALALAKQTGSNIQFDFNGTTVVATGAETAEELEAKWRSDMDSAHQAWVSSAEYREREAKRAAEWQVKISAHLTETATTEESLRATTSPQPYTTEQLAEYVNSLVTREHDYGTCVYAMSLAATAAFNYVAHKLGVTGFQASCADLDFVRRSRHIEGPFMLIKGEDALYPQYDLPAKLSEAMESWKPWLGEQARKMLRESASAHPNVVAHWKRLAEAVR